jgi:3-oxoadipate enol-lactonase
MASKRINGTDISYTDRGSGTPLVLLHGFPLDSRMWDAQVSELSSRWRVIAPDHRGFGQSRSDQSFTIESLADDAHMLLRELGALPCVLTGLSMGGYVALAYARKYPTDLRALILIDTKAEGDSAEAKEGRQKMIDSARTGGSKAVADQMMPKMLAEETPKSRPHPAQAHRQMMEASPPKTIEHALTAMRDRSDQTANLPSIPVPTLILVGDHDRITPPDVAESMRSKIPHARLTIIQGAGHMSPMEQPAQVNQAITRFLSSLS